MTMPDDMVGGMVEIMINPTQREGVRLDILLRRIPRLGPINREIVAAVQKSNRRRLLNFSLLVSV